MRKIVFVEPKSTHLHVYSRIAIPRLGAVLLGTIARDLGYDARVYIEDIAPIDMSDVLGADVVGVSTITSTAPPSYALAEKVRAAGIPAVLGGTHTSFLPEEGLQHADYVIRGEGEGAFVELLEALQGKRDLASIQNLSYKRDGRIVHNPERPKLRDLDATPVPDFGLVEGWKPGGIVSIATSRGCPFSCTFCSVPGMYGHAFRTHSVDRVLTELRHRKDASYIFFADDIFNANKKRTKELLSRMIAEGLTPEWGAQVRTEAADDPEMLELMRRSNCFNVYVGFESINPRTLKLFNKKQDLAKIERSIDAFHRHNVKIHGMFVVGSDEDEVETLDATARFAVRHGLESVQFMILTPCPGSPDWENLYARGGKDILTKDWSLYDGHHVVHQPRKMSPYELQVGAMKAMKKFYSWGTIVRSLLLRRDGFTAGIQLYGKHLLRDWFKANAAYVAKLKRELYGEVERVRKAGEAKAWKRVAVPDMFLQHQLGGMLQRFLSDLGVEVVPLPTQAQATSEAYILPGAADALHRLRERVDLVIAPIVKRAAQGQEDFSNRLNALAKSLYANYDRVKVITLPINIEQGPIFESYAKIGLLFTNKLNRVRQAYYRAGERLGFWGANTLSLAPSAPAGEPTSHP
ncbi:MAG: B12-binding domain-containing radical SAM protein [candidate division NC10 bacterium]|nr:B12-binding domain-containing radical SAM protein [candidate division NC10 bacterium]